jgi:hypothetical protein
LCVIIDCLYIDGQLCSHSITRATSCRCFILNLQRTKSLLLLIFHNFSVFTTNLSDCACFNKISNSYQVVGMPHVLRLFRNQNNRAANGNILISWMFFAIASCKFSPAALFNVSPHKLHVCLLLMLLRQMKAGHSLAKGWLLEFNFSLMRNL